MVSSIFTADNIFISDQEFATKDDLFAFVASEAKALGVVDSEAACLAGLKARESQQTTGFQDGFAIPHCKDDTVNTPSILFIKSKPIPWDSLDGNPITNSFALLIPSTGAELHLKYLSQIARSLIDDDFRAELKDTNDLDKLYSLISSKLGV